MNLFDHPDFQAGFALGQFLRITKHFRAQHGVLEMSVTGKKRKNVPIIATAWRSSKRNKPHWQSLN